MDVTIIACCGNLMTETSGLKAHETLAPASARYAKRQMMWGGKVRRDQFRKAKTTAIAASTGQKILFSQRGAMVACSLAAADKPVAGAAVRNINSGDTITEKAHAEIGMITGAKDLARPNSEECVGALDILALDLASALNVP
jgi:hypothetical protein